MIIDNVGEFLKINRKNKNYQQEDVAEFLKCNRASISHYENNKNNLPISHFLKLLQIYGYAIVPANASWKGLSDERKYSLVKNESNKHMFDIVEEIENELKEKNT